MQEERRKDAVPYDIILVYTCMYLLCIFLLFVDEKGQFDGLGANHMVFPSFSGSLIGVFTHGQSQGCR